MVEKTISRKELSKLAEGGAEIEFDPKSVSIEQFGDLVEAVKQMAANEAERIKADIARNQTSLEVVAALQQLIRKAESNKSQPLDLKPLREVVNELRAGRQSRQPVDYDFNIVRGGGDGYQPAMRIEARAVKPTLN